MATVASHVLPYNTECRCDPEQRTTDRIKADKQAASRKVSITDREAQEEQKIGRQTDRKTQNSRRVTDRQRNRNQ